MRPGHLVVKLHDLMERSPGRCRDIFLSLDTKLDRARSVEAYIRLDELKELMLEAFGVELFMGSRERKRPSTVPNPRIVPRG